MSYGISYKGLSEGEHEFEFDLDDRFFQAFEGSEIRGGRAKAVVKLTRAATFLTLDFAIDGQVAVECDRCLELYMMPVEYRGGFKVRFGDTVADFDGEIMWLGHNESTINVAQYIYESIVLSLPYRKVHPDREDGSPGCDPEILRGVSLISEEEFERAEAGSELQKMAENPEWQKLQQLRESMAKEGEE